MTDSGTSETRETPPIEEGGQAVVRWASAGNADSSKVQMIPGILERLFGGNNTMLCFSLGVTLTLHRARQQMSDRNTPLVVRMIMLQF